MKISNQVNYIKEDKGITLIALIVTVIVLAILVGVSIGMIAGNNGIMNKTIDATDKTNQLTAEEKVETEVANSYGKNGNIDLDELNENLKNNIKGIELNGSPISDSNKIESLPVTVVVDGYEVEIKDEITAELPEGFRYGDVNQDGIITDVKGDAALLQEYLNGLAELTEIQKKAADVSGDGQITKLDQELIQRYTAKTIPAFPAEDPNVKYYTLGDVDEDGAIENEDAVLVEQHINHTIYVPLSEIQKLAADVNEDGVIDYRDVDEIKRMVSEGM